MSVRKLLITFIGLVGLCLLFFAFYPEKKEVAYKNIIEGSIELCRDCPPGFRKDSLNNCINQSLYNLYNSPNNKGLGGLKVGLPPVRDGFTPQQIDLGRYLFFDPILSADHTISCASCHQPQLGFGDGKAKSIGIDGQELRRSAPSLWNVAYFQKFFWDARATSLEEQMAGPLFSKEEMGSDPQELKRKLNANPTYRKLFAEAFQRSEVDSIHLNELYLAIAAFESSLISLNSRYDQYAHGYADALNADELAGLNVFRSFVARCAECHTPPLFSNQQIAVIGTPQDKENFDEGAETPYKDPSMRGGFKVPSLRNIEKTGPYMHSGHFTDLKEAIRFYTKGRGHAVPKGENLYLHWHIWEPNLTEREIDQLSAFLLALTDETFMPKIPEKLPSEIKIN